MAGISRAELNNAADLMTAIRSGQQVKKFDAAKVPARARPAFGRKSSEVAVSKAVLLQEITPAQAHVLRNTDNMKAQAAWHGTPQTAIEKFLSRLLGTGEGAHAFGWGLYFANKKAVADWYRVKLTMDTTRPSQQIVQVNGQDIIDWVGDRFGDVSRNSDWERASYEVATAIHDYVTHGGDQYNGWLDALHAAFDKHVVGVLADAKTEDRSQWCPRDQRRVARIFNGLQMKQVSFDYGPTGGALYKVEIPENNVLLDLDQKLGIQPPAVRAGLEKLRGHLADKGLLGQYEDKYGAFGAWTGHTLQMKVMPRDMLIDDAFPSDATDPELAEAIADDDGKKATSLYLRELGIPGNRYLDRDSRDPTQTTKTHNYVIYDDSLIEITGREVKATQSPSSVAWCVRAAGGATVRPDHHRSRRLPPHPRRHHEPAHQDR